MAWPDALGERPLDQQEAYEALSEFGRRYGREPLRLLMHASVPETLRPELLNLVRQNFLPARDGDATLEADVLFSPLCASLGDGYYRIDPQVRWHALALLRSEYRDERRSRGRRVAELLWRWIEAMEPLAGRDADARLGEYLAIQRWVALAFLAPADAARAFAEALREAGAGPRAGAAAVLRLGGLAAAIELPLAHEPALIAYARGLDALERGDEERAVRLMRGLGEGDLRVGGVVLKGAGKVLREWRGVAAMPDPPSTEPDVAAGPASAVERTFVLIQPTRSPTGGGRGGDVEAAFALIAQALHPLGIDPVRFDASLAQFLAVPDRLLHLLRATVVLIDLSGQDIEEAACLLGICQGLRPDGAIVVADARTDADMLPPDVPAVRYALEPGADGQPPWRRLEQDLRPLLDEHGGARSRSPLFAQIPGLQPPRWLSPVTPTAPPSPIERELPRCLMLLGGMPAPDAPASRREPLQRTYDYFGALLMKAGYVPQSLDGVEDIAGTLLRAIVGVDLVIVDASAASPAVMCHVGQRWAVRPAGTLVVVEASRARSIAWGDVVPLRTWRAPEELDAAAATRQADELVRQFQAARRTPVVDSPVYAATPGLVAPVLPAGTDSPLAGQAAAGIEAPAVPAPATSVKLFISYLHEYRAHAEALRRRLVASGLQVRCDLDLKPGDEWDKHLTQWLDEADVVLAIAGRRSQGRPLPMREIERAIAAGKLLVPVAVDAFDEPRELSRRMFANVDGSGAIRHLAGLSGAPLEEAWDLTARNVLGAVEADRARRLGAVRVSVEPSPADADADADKARLAAARRHREAGLVHLGQGRPDEARRSFEQALAAAYEATTVSPEAIAARRELALSQRLLGDVLRETGLLAEALDHFLEALRLAETVTASSGSDDEDTCSVIAANRRVGEVLGALGRSEQAEDSLERALVLAETAILDLPEQAGIRLELVLAKRGLAESANLKAGYGRALGYLDSALSDAKRLVDMAPDEAGHRHEWFLTLVARGKLMRMLGEQAEALAMFRSALDVAERLADDQPGRADFKRDFMISCRRLGSLLRSSNHPAEAILHSQRAVAVAEQLAALPASGIRAQRDLQVSYRQLGDVLRAAGREADARPVEQRSLALARRIAGAEPDSADAQRALIHALTQIGPLSGSDADAHLVQAWSAASILARLPGRNMEDEKLVETLRQRMSERGLDRS